MPATGGQKPIFTLMNADIQQAAQENDTETVRRMPAEEELIRHGATFPSAEDYYTAELLNAGAIDN